jgi:hypothetical protein
VDGAPRGFSVPVACIMLQRQLLFDTDHGTPKAPQDRAMR